MTEFEGDRYGVLHFTFAETERYTLPILQGQCMRLESLLEASAGIAPFIAPRVEAFEGSDDDRRHVNREAEWAATSMMRDHQILHISYASPLEVYIMMTGPALRAVMWLHEQYQRQRLIKSNTDVQIATNRQVLTHVQENGLSSEQIEQRLNDSIKSLAELETITPADLPRHP